jgi:hypothetical protein
MDNQNKDKNFNTILERLKKSPKDMFDFYKADKLIIKDYIEEKQGSFKFRIYENVIVIPGGPGWVYFIDNEDKYHWVTIEKVDEIIYPKKSKDFFIGLNLVMQHDLIDRLIALQDSQKRGEEREGTQ